MYFVCVIQITLFIAHPQLKNCVKQAIERAIQEMLAPAIERATKIAVTTSEQIVKKVCFVAASDNNTTIYKAP